ncbi:MAG: HEAT repeat domain-containing protein [Elusimicrobia bacterium]|nr:HEAT repeat domain-containing protein [Elusimicrobiota bacterium]
MRKIPKEKLKSIVEDAKEDMYLLTPKEIEFLKCRSPLTDLPGNAEIKEAIMKHFINGSDENIIAYFDLNNFKAYNDTYGFVKGDIVIKTVSEKFTQINRGFSGHIGGDDFVAIMKEKDFDEFWQELIYFFEKKLCEFYDTVDYERGCIVSFNRQGEREIFPLMGITMVAFKNLRAFSTPEGVGEYASALKKIAKLKTKPVVGNSIVFKTEPGQITPLKEIIFDEKIPINIRRGVVEALGELKDFSYENILIEILKKPSANLFLKKSALYSLGKLRERKTATIILGFLKHASPHLRMRAVEALGEMGLAEYGEQIAELVEDGNFFVKEAAVIALGKVSQKKFIPLLKQKLEEKNFKNASFLSLVMLEDREILENVPIFVKDDTVPMEYRIRALRIYAEAELPINWSNARILFNGLKSQRVDMIVEILKNSKKILKKINLNEEELCEIFYLRKHLSWRVRRAMCDFCAAVRGEVAEKILESIAEDRSSSVREKAISTFKFFPEKYRFVLRFFNDPDANVRNSAVSCIKYMEIPKEKLPSIIEKLRILLKDPSQQVAKNSAVSIIHILRKSR